MPRVGQKLGGFVRLECRVSASPQAVVTWQKDDVTVTNSDKYHVEDGYRYSKLLIMPVTAEDYGNYTCVATNTLGSDQGSITLYSK